MNPLEQPLRVIKAINNIVKKGEEVTKTKVREEIEKEKGFYLETDLPATFDLTFNWFISN